MSLDEFPLFSIDVVEALRQPLESGEVTIARGEESATFPARGMVVLAANPCPCGDAGEDAAVSHCNCEPPAMRRYQRKLRGPLADRVDIERRLSSTDGWQDGDELAPRETTVVVRARVTAARQRQARRYAGLSWRLNAHAPAQALRESWPLGADSQERLDTEVRQGRLTRRGATRVHRLAWTITDLAGRAAPADRDLDVALALRRGDPLPLRALERAG